MFVQASRRHRAHGPRGRGRRLRRLHPQDRRRPEAAAGRRRGAAQFHQPAAGGRLARERARRRRRDRGAGTTSAIAPIRSSPSAPKPTRRATRSWLMQVSRGRGLRRDEHHAAVGLGVVRQRHRHDAGDARLLPLAVGADRAAGRRLCGPAVLPAARWRALRARRVNMDVPISLGVLLALGMSLVETAHACRARLFRFRHRCCCSSCCAAAYLDHAMRRKTRAVAGNLAALKAEFAHRFDGGGARAACRPRRCRPGDRLLVRPGERVPADGIVLVAARPRSTTAWSPARRAPRRSQPGAHALCRQHELLRHARRCA